MLGNDLAEPSQEKRRWLLLEEQPALWAGPASPSLPFAAAPALRPWAPAPAPHLQQDPLEAQLGRGPTEPTVLLGTDLSPAVLCHHAVTSEEGRQFLFLSRMKTKQM